MKFWDYTRLDCDNRDVKVVKKWLMFSRKEAKKNFSNFSILSWNFEEAKCM